jgi:magnesium chelatase family protein
MLLGPPRTGTPMLARRPITILPAMTLAKALDIMRVPRTVGRIGDCSAAVTACPCHAPHHTISDVGLLGEARCRCRVRCRWAHHGVLCLDARPECGRHGLAGLRQPLEEGVI